MSKIWIIVNREFMTRVRKRSFLVMTIFVPILLGVFYAFLLWLLLRDDNQARTIAVVNESGVETPLEDVGRTRFVYEGEGLAEADYGRWLKEKGYYALARVPRGVMKEGVVEVYSLSLVPMEVKQEIARQVQRKVEERKRSEIAERSGIPNLDKQLRETRTPVVARTLVVSEAGETRESSAELTSMMGVVAGLVIYIFIFMYSSQVMQGVVEEKKNRIIEVLVSSVKPFQFLMGKIIGVAAVGLLQFLIWIGVGIVLVVASQLFLLPGLDVEALRTATDVGALAGSTAMGTEQLEMLQYVAKMVDPGFVMWFLGAFLFYFLGGYLLYAALFAAVGAAADSETDTQQFMTPLSVLLLAALYVGFAAMKNPDTSLVFWGSLFPFTSPIVMLVRLPFGVPAWEVVLSMGLLVGAFLFFTWLSGKIYRVGILMYGKKPSWRELYRWMKYK